MGEEFYSLLWVSLAGERSANACAETEQQHLLIGIGCVGAGQIWGGGQDNGMKRVGT